MSTSTMNPSARTAAMLFATDNLARELTPRHHFKKGDDGSSILVLEDVAVFRSGTFRDSLGYQMTWEGIHLDQMAAYFTMLTGRNIFADVPVRDGHPGFLVSGQAGNGKVIGWHTGLRVEKRTSNHDGKEYDYLIATYEIIDPEAQQAITSGLWRNRSAEVGTYVTNDEAEYWPVYMGVAYVDIPAVEGLNSFAKQHNTSLMMEEGSMSDSTNSGAGTAATGTPAAPAPPVPPAAPAAPETPASGAQHGAATQVQAFSIGGESTTDYARVQAHITALETANATLEQFQRETTEAARRDFVTQLASSNRILATEIEGLQAFAIGLSAEQFETWSKAYGTSPAAQILGQYGSPTTEGAPTQPVGGQPDAAAAQLATDKAVVLAHKRSGKTPEFIKTTASYKRVVSVEPSFAL